MAQRFAITAASLSLRRASRLPRVASRLASARAGRAPRAAPFDGSTVRHHCAASRAAPSRPGCRRDRGRLGTNSPFRGSAGTPASQARSDRYALARYGFVRTSRRPSGLPSRIILPSPRSGGRGPLVTTRSHGGNPPVADCPVRDPRGRPSVRGRRPPWSGRSRGPPSVRLRGRASCPPGRGPSSGRPG